MVTRGSFSTKMTTPGSTNQSSSEERDSAKNPPKGNASFGAFLCRG
jgi:hypothetical protein